MLLFVNGENEQTCGALIEAGAASAAGRQLFVVSTGASPFSHHPNCRNFSALADAIAAIVPMQGCAWLLGQHLRHEQPVILVLAWQSTTTGRARAVAGPAAKPAARLL